MPKIFKIVDIIINANNVAEKNKKLVWYQNLHVLKLSTKTQPKQLFKKKKMFKIQNNDEINTRTRQRLLKKKKKNR